VEAGAAREGGGGHPLTLGLRRYGAGQLGRRRFANYLPGSADAGDG
jgi:hypothetical protein